MFISFLTQVNHYLSAVKVLKKIYREKNFRANVLKVAPISFTIARVLRTKAQVISMRSKENVSVFDIYGVNMGIKCKNDSEFSRVFFGDIP